jgi:hypothetical protein
MRVVVMAMMEMRQHPAGRVRERAALVNTFKLSAAAIFWMQPIRILHAP